MQGPNATSWQLATVTPVTTALPSGAGVATVVPSFLGYGLVSPFRRAANDFAAASGADLVKACVYQLLGTRCDSPYSRGELPWRTEFGSILGLLRHKRNDYMLAELARAYVQDAIAAWEPRVQVSAVTVVQPPQQPKALFVRVSYSIITANTPTNNVQATQYQTDVPLSAAA